MQNPCEECLVKVNCTAICDRKKNYKTLLRQAVNHGINTYKHRKHHRKYTSMLNETITDESRIIYRRRSLKCDDNF